MRILQVIPTLEAGGAEGFVTNLGVSLSGLGADVRFFLMAGVRGERGQVLVSRLHKAGIKVFGAEEHNVRSPINIVCLVNLINSWRPEIVQVNMYPAEVLVAIARVITLGSGACYVRRLANTEQVGCRSPVIVRMMDRVYPQTISCSPTVTQAYKNFMGVKYKTKLVTISNGGLMFDSIPTTEEKHVARKKLGILNGSFVIIHIGRMCGSDRLNASLKRSQKAHDILLKAFAVAFGSNHDCQLLLVGDGPLRAEAEALTRSLKIEKQVHFLGLQSEPWLAIKAANMFFFPSRYEGLPNVIPEAVSGGLPIVASDIPEIRSLYSGDAWLLKPVDDVEAFAEGLRTVYSNSEMFVRCARDAAQEFRVKFSMTTCAEKYLQAYESASGWGKARNKEINP